MGTHLLVIALLICLNEKATGAQHVIAFYPFVFIVIAYSICELGRWIAKSQTAAGIFMGVCLLPLITAQTVLDARYLESFQAKGGYGFWSDAIYDLASFVRENPGKNYLLMEWGFSNQLVLLSNGRIRYEDFDCRQNNLETCMESLLTRMNTCICVMRSRITTRMNITCFWTAILSIPSRCRPLRASAIRPTSGKPLESGWAIWAGEFMN